MFLNLVSLSLSVLLAVLVLTSPACPSQIASPEGIKKVCTQYPKMVVITAKVDERLNEKFYIVPGLGDFGDVRLAISLFCTLPRSGS